MSSSSITPTVFKSLAQDVATYLNIFNEEKEKDADLYTLSSYINKETEVVNETLSISGLIPIIIGNGTKIIKQYPNNGSLLNLNSKVFLLTNSNEYTMPDIRNWSRSDVKSFCDLIGLNVTFDGYGYVTEYSIPKNTTIDLNTILTVTLKGKYITTE